MSYQITLSNGQPGPTIVDFSEDTSTSLVLLGRGVPNYGTSVADNFIHLLENFSSAQAPTSPLKGQFWFNSLINKPEFWDGTAWHILVGAESLVNFLTGNETITLTGDVTGSGATNINAQLNSLNPNVGTYAGLTVNAKGLVTSARPLNISDITTGLGYVPVHQGGGVGQLQNQVYLGWSSASKLKLTVDVSDLGNVALENWTQSNFLNVNTGGTVNGTINVIPTAGTIPSIYVNSAGVNGANICLLGNGTTTPNKYIRAVNGEFSIVSSDYSREILTIYDDGHGNIPGDFTVGGLLNMGSLGVFGNGQINGTLDVSGNMSSQGSSTISGFLTVGSGITSNQSIVAAGNVTAQGGGFIGAGNIQIGGNLLQSTNSGGINIAGTTVQITNQANSQLNYLNLQGGYTNDQAVSIRQFGFGYGTNGWAYFPAGSNTGASIFLQWGTVVVSPNNVYQSFVFPTGFPNDCLSITISYQAEIPPPNGAVGAEHLDKYGFRASNSATAGSNACNFFAIGY